MAGSEARQDWPVQLTSDRYSAEHSGTMEKQGSLACVGLGMTLGAHLGPRSRNHIEQADVVFVAVSDPLVELWVQEMHPDVRSLQPYYREGKPRTETYREMVEALVTELTDHNPVLLKIKKLS